MFRSGFPGIRNKGERSRKLLLNSYVINIIEHEFSENGFTMKKPESILAWMKAYADSVGTTTNFQTIIDSAMANNSEAPSRPTANNYREALQILYIIDEVPSFLPFGKLYPNSGKSPKYFMLNPPIVLSLLNVSREQLENYQILKHIGKLNQSFIDQLLESLVYQSLIVYADANAAKLSQFRDSR